MAVGFIGLGVMGTPMASNLINAGHQLVVHRVKERSRFLLEQGAAEAASPRAVAEHCEVVVCMLPDTPDVEAVLFGEDGVAAGLGPGSLVVDMSSISPVRTVDFAARIEALGSDYVDAPVSGGEVGAREGTLTVFAGGSEAAVARAMPLLQAMGRTITHIGAVGAGQTAKVANQVIVAQTIQAVAEGLALARAAGVDPAVVRQSLSGGFASSRILELHGQRMIEGAFDPGFRLRLHRKDLSLAQQVAEHHGVTLPGTDAVAAQMDTALQKDWGELDHSALIRLVSDEDAR